jgi:hypothetical protein
VLACQAARFRQSFPHYIWNYCHVLPGQRGSNSWMLVWYFVLLGLSLGRATIIRCYRLITHKPVTCLLVPNCSCNCLCSWPFWTVVPTELFWSESESYITTDSQSASLSWNKAHIWGLRPDIYLSLTITAMFLWASSLTRGRVWLLYMLLALASVVFLGS